MSDGKSSDEENKAQLAPQPQADIEEIKIQHPDKPDEPVQMNASPVEQKNNQKDAQDDEEQPQEKASANKDLSEVKAKEQTPEEFEKEVKSAVKGLMTPEEHKQSIKNQLGQTIKAALVPTILMLCGSIWLAPQITTVGECAPGLATAGGWLYALITFNWIMCLVQIGSGIFALVSKDTGFFKLVGMSIKLALFQFVVAFILTWTVTIICSVQVSTEDALKCSSTMPEANSMRLFVLIVGTILGWFQCVLLSCMTCCLCIMAVSVAKLMASAPFKQFCDENPVAEEFVKMVSRGKSHE